MCIICVVFPGTVACREDGVFRHRCLPETVDWLINVEATDTVICRQPCVCHVSSPICPQRRCLLGRPFDVNGRGPGIVVCRELSIGQVVPSLPALWLSGDVSC